MANALDYSGREYALIGDAVWGLLVKDYLVEHSHTVAKELHVKIRDYVSAQRQVDIYEKLSSLVQLNDDERLVFKRGRNIKVSKPSSHDITVYRIASGFEALIGFWYKNNQKDKLDFVIKLLFENFSQM